MTPLAIRQDPAPLEAVLLDIHTTLSDLLVAADEQHAAVVADDRGRLEAVTRLQERLSARLARTEGKRLDLLSGRSLAEVLADLPTEGSERLRGLSQSIAQVIRELQPLHARNANLLERSAELAGQTATFLQRLVSPLSPSYGARGLRSGPQSLLVDRRA